MLFTPLHKNSYFRSIRISRPPLCLANKTHPQLRLDSATSSTPYVSRSQTHNQHKRFKVTLAKEERQCRVSLTIPVLRLWHGEEAVRVSLTIPCYDSGTGRRQ
ncbi:unnamed protein product [Boreogadus saida]